MVLVSGENVSIDDGRVLGDLIVGADRVAIRGEVHGNVHAFARTLELSGVVDDSMYGFDHVLIVTGEIRSDLYAFAEHSRSAGRADRPQREHRGRGSVDGPVVRDIFWPGRERDTLIGV